MSEWQPIETAPRDRWILLTGGEVAESDNRAFRGDPPPMVIARWTDDPDLYGGDWLYAAYDSFCDLDYRDPTHWMPHPDPLPGAPA